MSILHTVKKYIPQPLLAFLRPAYHFILAIIGALIYRHPSRHIKVIGVTGTKGKTSTTEIINAIFEEAGYTTAVSNTVRFKIGEQVKRNKKKMTMPGRFFLQKLLRTAVNNECQYAIIEMTSEGVVQHRHNFIQLNTLVFTNLSPEHIESHGSYENYRDAKLELAYLLERSPKENRAVVANIDDSEGEKFLSVDVQKKRPYSLSMLDAYESREDGFTITLKEVEIHSPLGGTFNIYNTLAAIETARAEGISLSVIKEAVESYGGTPGRLERVQASTEKLRKKQNFTVIVDYAHTPDSLEKVYKVFEKKNKVCVLGNTGGGRDKWKRKEMAKIAENYCNNIILTNEDPYDEDPKEIVDQMARAITIPKYNIIMDRRNAIRRAIETATEGDVVLITGKGTDPYIMGPNGTKKPWDDATIAREELDAVLQNTPSRETESSNKKPTSD